MKFASKAKPHNNLPGYVAERKSRHEKLPGYFAIFDRTKTDVFESSERWIVVHFLDSGNNTGCFVGVASVASARLLMKDMADGGNDADFGQFED